VIPDRIATDGGTGASSAIGTQCLAVLAWSANAHSPRCWKVSLMGTRTLLAVPAAMLLAACSSGPGATVTPLAPVPSAPPVRH